MKNSQILAAWALVAFLLSHFLPSFADVSGFGCERFCWKLLFTDPLNKAYYAAFGITNLAFVVAVVMSFARGSNHVTLRCAAWLMLSHVFSWLVLVTFSVVSGDEKHFRIQIGYFAWATAFALLVLAFREKRKEANQAPEPTAPSGRGSS